MSPPIINAITPDHGHPGGNYLLVIQGQDFVVPPYPTPTELPVSEPEETVSVTVNGRAATNVEVWDYSLITCICPPFRGDPDQLSANPGLAVDVVVTNLGPPAEPTTVTDGFAYRRTDLTKTEGVLYTIIRTLLLELRRQVINNIAVSTHVDYDGSTGDGLNIVELAKVPGIALDSVSIVDNHNFWEKGKHAVQDGTQDNFTEYGTPRAVNLVFDASIIGENTNEAAQLAQEFMLFFSPRRTPRLCVPSDDTDPDSEEIRFPMILTSPPSKRGNANAAGTTTLSATFEIQRVLIDADDLIAVNWGKVLEDPPDTRIRILEQGND
jgi:hypothetical protein